MATIDQQFVEYIVKTLVNKPDKVVVERKIDERGVLLSLTVDPEDIGRVIGRRGITAQSLRMLLRALGTKQDARYNLKIVNSDSDEDADEDAPSEHKTRRSSAKTDEAETEVAEEEVEVTEETDDSEDEAGDDSSALAEKTRAEMADLDDLDI